MKKKVLGVVLMLVVMLTGLLTGCAGKADTQKTSSTNSGEKKTVVIGLDDTFVPMGFRDEKGEIVGFDVDLAKEVFKRAGMEIKFQPIDWAMKETELNSGNIDLIWNGYSITEERKQKVAITKPYISGKQIIITMAGSSINSKSDLKGKAVATQSGSSTIDCIKAEPGMIESFKNGELVLFDTNDEALRDLEAGRVDAVVADEVYCRYYITKRGADKYKVLKEDFGNQDTGIAVRKSDPELLKLVEDKLDEMKKDGTSAGISKKWFGEDIIK